MASKKKTKDRKDRDLEDIKLSSNPEEYTFQPNKTRKQRGRTNRATSPNVEASKRLYETQTRNNRKRSQPAP